MKNLNRNDEWKVEKGIKGQMLPQIFMVAINVMRIINTQDNISFAVYLVFAGFSFSNF